ncbi:MAG: 5'/3'-nucleotidase SurE [Alphaproteobacteria bacterium]|nr:5'/3'-nucleotidase SurE [Alphaproteobacteria bacterium]MDX5369869.1 5'/3'-nucleotidase SurE [Alphaproteobacteria bacterium]MDX5464485.1 5'/3'-nucleotidase SurE [Alphaproteobacteria bacterium]
MTKLLPGCRILLTNDDGIHAPGLKVLEAIARQLSDDVWVVAPETEQSGASHSLTLHLPLRLRQVEERRYAVLGTPTDCVMMAVKHILKDHKPDLILSGVNRGQNMAEDVTYSGTIAAAMEGTILGVPSIALSQAWGINNRKVPWETAEAHGAPLVKKLVDAGWPAHVLVNINFPDVHPDGVAGVKVTRQGQRDQSALHILERQDGRGVPYFWLGFRRVESKPGEGTDLNTVYQGAISVTPLHLDLTERSVAAHFEQAIG